MADTKEKEPKQARQADPGEAPEGQEPKAADVAPAEAPAAPKPKQKDKQKDKQKVKKPAEGKPAAPADPEGPPPEPAPTPRLQPVVTRAKNAIANFNLREGMPVGCSVTLRAARMFEFLDRFITIAVPRMRDFRGLPTDSFDGRGNYTIGIKEQMIFPEIDYDKVEKIHGMDITLVTSAGRDDTALALLRELGMPFRGEAPVAVA